jgi:transcriptional regulator with XRE-family HTH domain
MSYAAFDEHEEAEDTPTVYAEAVGSRLRAVRKEMRLSLQAVEALSDQQFKASVLGAYERGERAISVPRLQRLARLYDVPVDQFLPWNDGAGVVRPGSDPAARADTDRGPESDRGRLEEKVLIDLDRLEASSGPEVEVLTPCLSSIRAQRRGFSGPIMAVRAEDLRILASLLGETVETLCSRLDELGLRPRPPAT